MRETNYYSCSRCVYRKRIKRRNEIIEKLGKENAALKEELEDLKKTFDKIYAENRAVNQTNDLKIAQLLQLEKEKSALKREMAKQTEQYTEDNRKLQKQVEKLKENAMAISFDYDEETEFVPTEVRCHFCNYLMGTMEAWNQSIITDSKCPECKSDRFVFIKKEAGK